MNLLKQFPIKCHFIALSHNGRFIANVKSMNVGIYDLEDDCPYDTLNIKYCGHAVFSNNDTLLILKTTEGKLIVYDLIKKEIIFSKKFGKDDGYNLAFINENQIITGDWNHNNNVLLDLSNLEMKKNSMQSLGLCKYLTKYKDGFLVCHNPINEDTNITTFLGYSVKQSYLEKTEVLLLDKHFKPIETFYELNTSLAQIFSYANGKLYLVIRNEIKVIDIDNHSEKNFYIDGFEVILILSISKSGKYIFISDGIFTGLLLNDEFEVLYDFKNSNQMTGLTATFFDDESKIIVNSNGKLSIYMI